MTTPAKLSYTPTVTLSVLCRPWSCDERPAVHSVLVDGLTDGHPRVRVWDPVGKLHTVCHALTPAECERIIAQAKEVHARYARYAAFEGKRVCGRPNTC